MLPFCQQCSFLIVLHFYATGSSGATGHQNTFCTLPRDAQHVAASGKPGKDQRKGGGRERGGSHQPQSPCCALPNRGRPRLPSPLPSGERRCPCTTRAPPPRQTPPPARHGPAPSPSPALRLCGLKGRDLARSAPPRPGVHRCGPAWRARVRRRCCRASCSARCPSSTSTRTRTR